MEPETDRLSYEADVYDPLFSSTLFLFYFLALGHGAALGSLWLNPSRRGPFISQWAANVEEPLEWKSVRPEFHSSSLFYPTYVSIRRLGQNSWTTEGEAPDLPSLNFPICKMNICRGAVRIDLDQG